MVHAKTFLLQNICDYNKENGLKSLGRLHAEHIDDLAEVIKQYAEKTVIEVTERLNKGEKIKINDVIIFLGKPKKKTKTKI